MSAGERTGWRDEAISARHREWGFNCPAADLDFVVIEYNLGAPVALVEYKHLAAFEPNLKHPTYMAHRTLANNSRIPYMIVFYGKDPWWFRIIPANEFAADFFTPNQIMTEYEYVTKLYLIRSIAVDEVVMRKLCRELPPEANL